MTLVEILLVTSLISGMSIAIYQSLNNGLKVWQKTKQMVVEEDVVIFLDKISYELRNTFLFSRFGHYGDEHQFAFPTIVRMLQSVDGDNSNQIYTDQIGQVEYFFDPLAKILYKRKANYALAVENLFFEDEVVLRNVENLKFTYIYFTEHEEVVSDVTYDQFPAGVNIQITVTQDSGAKSLEKYISIPVGG